jgi:hypothetical protein
MGELILRELDHFDNIPERKRRFVNPEDYQADVVLALKTVQREVQKNEIATRSDPFIACLRLVRNGREEHLLISRSYTPDHDPLSPDCLFASYLSPMGSIAARGLGKSYSVRVPAGEVEVTVLERSEFRSVRKRAWDAVSNEYAAGVRIRLSIPSARELLAQSTAEIQPLPQEEEAAAPVRQGHELLAIWGTPEDLERSMEAASEPVFSRRVIASVASKVELRDRPILDELQDPIFRLPVDARLVLTGAAGTGKSTVLIKRLSQKTKGTFLEPEEIAGFSDQQLDHLLDPERSWVLFTPNDLLRNYLKEALGREQLPATQETVRTWSDQRTRLARDVFKILKVGDKGTFTRMDGVVFHLNDARRQRLLAGYRRHCDERYRNALRGAARALENAEALCAETERATWQDGPDGPRSSLSPRAQEFNREFTEFCSRALSLIGATVADPFDTVLDLQKLRQEFQSLRSRAEALGTAASDGLLKRVEGLRSHFPDWPLAEAPAKLHKLVCMTDAERGRVEGLTAGARRALKALEQGPFAPAVVLVRAWHRGLAPLSPLMRGLDALLRGFPYLYQEFRQQFRKNSVSAAKWLADDGWRCITDRRISDEEIDLLVYSILSTASDLFGRHPQLLWNTTDSTFLEAIKAQLRTVVAVDEAPDFSWVQLGCMYHLSHPAFRSFCMSGDLMQRVTANGLKDWEEVRAFAPDVAVHTLERVYRQSHALLRVAGLVYEIAMKTPPPFTSPFAEEDEPPPLRFRASDRSQSVRWVADRIVEVYESVGYLPSIAVFVADEADVTDTAAALAEVLAEHAIDVEACEKGKVLGVGDRVRVFSTEHIKGLEFHAVFLMDFERLNRRDGDLAMRYLYLSLTRSVMFLGLTMSGRFPQRLAPLADVLVEGDWRRYAKQPA